MQIQRLTSVPEKKGELPIITFECSCHMQQFNNKEELKKFHDDIQFEKKKVDLGKGCPRCGEGRLRLFEGRFGRFIGCDAFSVNKCRYKIQI